MQLDNEPPSHSSSLATGGYDLSSYRLDLHLSNNKIGTEGAIKLSEALIVNSTLAGLNLSNNEIGTEGAIKLSEALIVNSTLAVLDLSGNNIEPDIIHKMNKQMEEMLSKMTSDGIKLFEYFESNTNPIHHPTCPIIAQSKEVLELLQFLSKLSFWGLRNIFGKKKLNISKMLFVICWLGRFNLLRWLLVLLLENDYKSIKETINSKDQYGFTPLHAAAYNNHGAICKELLRHRADPTIPNDFDEIPPISTMNNSSSCITCLVQSYTVIHISKTSRDQIRQWALSIIGEEDSNVLFRNKIDGTLILDVTQQDFLSMGLPFASTKELLKKMKDVMTNREGKIIIKPISPAVYNFHTEVINNKTTPVQTDATMEDQNSISLPFEFPLIPQPRTTNIAKFVELVMDQELQRDDKQKIEEHVSGLQGNESDLSSLELESISYYTSHVGQPPFYTILNSTLSSRSIPSDLFPILYYLISGLKKLPNTQGPVYRGIRNYRATKHPRHIYEVGKTVVWVAFSSSTSDESVSRRDDFLGSNGTLFQIEAIEGKDISLISVRYEREILLLPNSHFKVLKVVKGGRDKPDFIQLQQIPTPLKYQLKCQ